MSEFVENKASKVYGFTVTLKGGEIRNSFIRCDLPSDFKKLEEFKKYYQDLKIFKRKIKREK